MFEINKNKIKITRGDTGIFNIEILDRITELPYEVQAGDTVRFTVKKSIYQNKPLIQKEGTSIQINPADTQTLMYGKYLYDVEITLANGMVQTIITPCEFEITSEVTWDYNVGYTCLTKTDIANQAVLSEEILETYDYPDDGVPRLLATLYIPKQIGDGTDNYNELKNKPQINNVVLEGNKTSKELVLYGRDNPETFVWEQKTAQDKWVIKHPLNKYPSITVVDSGGTMVEGERKYIDGQTVEVSFIGAFSGTVYLN